MEETNSLTKAAEPIILNYNSGKDKSTQIAVVNSIAKKYAESSTLIAACTEIASILKNSDLPIVFTMDILINSVIQKWLE